jgi:sec-independent protein translocase protein TatA
MFGLGLPEVMLILVIVGVLFFGTSKTTDFAQSIGRASGEFKKGKQQVERELLRAEAESVDEKK